MAKIKLLSFHEYVSDCLEGGESLTAVGQRLGVGKTKMHRWYTEGLPDAALDVIEVVEASRSQPSPSRGVMSVDAIRVDRS